MNSNYNTYFGHWCEHSAECTHRPLRSTTIWKFRLRVSRSPLRFSSLRRGSRSAPESIVPSGRCELPAPRRSGRGPRPAGSLRGRQGTMQRAKESVNWSSSPAGARDRPLSDILPGISWGRFVRDAFERAFVGFLVFALLFLLLRALRLVLFRTVVPSPHPLRMRGQSEQNHDENCDHASHRHSPFGSRPEPGPNTRNPAK